MEFIPSSRIMILRSSCETSRARKVTNCVPTGAHPLKTPHNVIIAVSRADVSIDFGSALVNQEIAFSSSSRNTTH